MSLIRSTVVTATASTSTSDGYVEVATMSHPSKFALSYYGRRHKVTHKEVLQQIIAILFLTPCLEGAQDILGRIGDALALGAETGSTGCNAAAGLERVGLGDEVEHF